jgi:hypothetical protein
MAWNIKADMLESCSCAVVCPCIFGPAKPDQEWCSGLFALNVTEGSSDGVDLSGTKILLHFELPGDFMGGIDKAKLYVDPSASDEQRNAIDAIFHGEKGGVWGGMKEAIKEWLPTSTNKIEFTNGGSPAAKVEGVGQVTLQPVASEDGTPAKVTGAPVLAAFGIASMQVAQAAGTGLKDPDMRAWESLGSGSVTQVEWTG